MWRASRQRNLLGSGEWVAWRVAEMKALDAPMKITARDFRGNLPHLFARLKNDLDKAYENLIKDLENSLATLFYTSYSFNPNKGIHPKFCSIPALNKSYDAALCENQYISI